MLRSVWCAKIAFATALGLWLLISGVARASAAQEDTPMGSAELINGILKKMGSGEKIDPAEFQKFVDLQNADLKTGPAVGSKVPDFALEDQNGRRLTLHDLMGPKGMLLVFTRSADW
jgi:cytochrome oxidase Cu insertion factor (SCO1/SenC/PrrC family)